MLRPQDCAYAAFYCEENVFHLLARDDLAPGDRYAVFISNPHRSCALWGQQQAQPKEPVVWDYHVVALVKDSLQARIYDLDARFGFPVPAADYLDGAFPLGDQIPLEFRPRFRVVSADELRASFASDRSHMLVDGAYRAPVPPWPPIRAPGAPASTLMQLVDTEAEYVGQCFDLSGLRAWLSIP